MPIKATVLVSRVLASCFPSISQAIKSRGDTGDAMDRQIDEIPPDEVLRTDRRDLGQAHDRAGDLQ